jgi:hypothetical protein
MTDSSQRNVFAEASAAVRWALNGHGEVEPAASTEFYNYVARLVLDCAWTVERS